MLCIRLAPQNVLYSLCKQAYIVFSHVISKNMTRITWMLALTEPDFDKVYQHTFCWKAAYSLSRKDIPPLN